MDGDRPAGMRLVVCFFLALALGLLAIVWLDWPWSATLAISTGTLLVGFVAETRERRRVGRAPRRSRRLPLGLHANQRSVREVLRLMLPILGAAAMLAVALLSGTDRVGQVLSSIAVGCLVWAVVAEHRRLNRADVRPSDENDKDVVRGPRAR